MYGQLRQFSCVVLDESEAKAQTAVNKWLMAEFPPQDEFEYEYHDTKMTFHFTWPDSGKRLPAPLDCVFIFVHENSNIEMLKQEFSKLQYIVHKVVISETGIEGEVFAWDIGAKHTTMNEDSDSRIQFVLDLDDQLSSLMKQVFEDIDTNQSGYIDMNELSNAAKSLGHDLTPNELKIVFDELDTNKDQKISFPEFNKWWKSGRMGKGRIMSNLVNYEIRAKSFLRRASSDLEEIVHDEFYTRTCNINITSGSDFTTNGYGISLDIRANSTDLIQQYTTYGGLEEDQQKVFLCMSLNLAPGVDSENVRDKIQSLMTKLLTQLASKITPGDGPVLSEFEFKYRARDGVFRIFLLLDHRSPALQLATEQHWKQISTFLPESLAQSLKITLATAANFGNLINTGTEKIFDMALSQAKFELHVELWDRILGILTRMICDDRFLQWDPLLSIALLQQGNLTLQYANVDQIPERLKPRWLNREGQAIREEASLAAKDFASALPVLPEIIELFKNSFVANESSLFVNWHNLSTSVTCWAPGVAEIFS